MSTKPVSAVLTIFAVLTPMPTYAILPPPRPPEYAAYGPLQVCAPEFSIDVKSTEALHIIGGIIRILHDEYIIAVKPVDPMVGAGKKSEAIRLSNGMVAYRYMLPTPDADRNLILASQSLGPEDIRYAISASSDPQKTVIVGSALFDGTATDKTTLTQIFSKDENRQGCISPQIALSMLSSEDPNDEIRNAYARRHFMADLYPHEPVPGPAFHCQRGIGYAIKEGERLYRPWKSLGRDGPSLVERGGVFVKISGPAVPKKRADANDANEHPIGLLHQSRLIYYPSRGVGPPYAPAGVREDGSWAIELGSYPSEKMEISFPASDKTPIGFGFLERLKFVEEDDSRCIEMADDNHNAH